MSRIVNITTSIGSRFAWQNANYWQDATRRAAIMRDFWSRVKLEKAKACWPWTGSLNTDGSPVFSLTAESWERADRFAWVMSRGPIPTNREVYHRCDTPACVNPAHLFLSQRRCVVH